MRTRIAMAVGLMIFGFAPMVVAQESDPSPETPREARQNAREDIREERQDVGEARREGRQEIRDARQNQRTDASQASHDTDKMTQKMVSCLLLSNHAEIELAKVALDKSQNEQVREFAQKLIDDHQAAEKRLKEFMPHVALDTSGESTETEASEPNTAEESAQTDTADTETAEATPATETQEADSTQVAEFPETDLHQGASVHHGTMEQLQMKIAKNELAMTKDVLMRFEGQDFDMGFLGQQIVAHTQMLAKLHAMKTEGNQKFQIVISELIGTVNDHFMDAMRISRELEDQEGNPARTTSTTTTSEDSIAQPRAVRNAGGTTAQTE